MTWLARTWVISGSLRRTSARPAAAGRVVEADVASATVLAAALERFAAGLQNRAARLVAAGARDAAAIGRVLALADAARQIALAHGQAVEGRTARAQPAGERLAEVLQRGARHVVIAGAVDLEPLFALFKLELAARDDAPAWRLRAGR